MRPIRLSQPVQVPRPQVQLLHLGQQGGGGRCGGNRDGHRRWQPVGRGVIDQPDVYDRGTAVVGHALLGEQSPDLGSESTFRRHRWVPPTAVTAQVLHQPLQ